MGNTQIEIDQDIIDKILTGGSRTRAQGTREVLNKITAGYLNKEDGGNMLAAVTYDEEFPLPTRKHLAYRGYVEDTISASLSGYFPLVPNNNVTANFAGAYNMNINNVVGVAFNGSTGGDFIVDMFDNISLTGSSSGNFTIGGYNNLNAQFDGIGYIYANTGLTLSGGYVYFEPINELRFKGSVIDSGYGIFNTNSLSSNRTYSWPDSSGTVALTSDLTNKWQNGGNAFLAGATLGTTTANNWGIIRGGVELVTVYSGGLRFQNVFGQAGTGAIAYTNFTGRLILGPENASTSGGCNFQLYGTTGGTQIGLPNLDQSFLIVQALTNANYSFFVHGSGNVLLGNDFGQTPEAKLDVRCFSNSDTNIGFKVKQLSGTDVFDIGEGGRVRGLGPMWLGTFSGDASALLDLVSTTRGLGLPSMTQAQRNAIASPRNGLLIHQTDNVPGVYARISGAWTALGGSGSSTVKRQYCFSMLGEANSTFGLMSKAGDVAQPTGNPSGAPTTSSGNPGITNGTVDPYIIPSNATITSLRIRFAGAAVGTGTVGTPTVRIRIYRVNYSTRTQLGSDIDITISATGVGNFNNSSADAFQTAVSGALSIAVSAGDLIGIEFVNQSGTNNGINAIRRLFAVLETTE